jgi:integrase
LQKLEEVRQGKIKPATCRNSMPSVRLFFDMNDITLNWKRLNKLLPSVDGNAKDEAYTREQIQQMLDHCDLRTRVVVLFLASSGMRLEGLAGLTDECIIPIYDEQDKSKVLAAQLIVYKGTPEEYVTFVTPEAYHAYSAYRELRIKYGEDIRPESPVISRRFNKQSDRSNQEKYLKHISPGVIGILLDIVTHKAGIRRPSKEYKSRFNIKRAHGFRKFFNTTISSLIGPDGKRMIDFIHKEWMLGHSLYEEHKMEEHYNRSQIAKLLLNDYLRAVKELTISDEERLKVQVRKLEVDISNLKTVEAEIAERDREIHKTRSQLEQLEKDMDKKIAEQVAKQVKRVMELRDSNPAIANFKPEAVLKKIEKREL